MNIYSLVISGSYEDVRVACFRDAELIVEKKVASKKASLNLITCIEDVLTDAEISLEKISFFVGNKGPGAFTTMRVAIVTLNGLAYSLSIPVFDFNLLEELILAKKNTSDSGIVLSILNAYSGLFFVSAYDLKNSSFIIKDQCLSVSAIEKEISSFLVKGNKVALVGDGLNLFLSGLKSSLIVEKFDEVNSTNLDFTNIVKNGLKAFENNCLNHAITPMYIKANFN